MLSFVTWEYPLIIDIYIKRAKHSHGGGDRAYLATPPPTFHLQPWEITVFCLHHETINTNVSVNSSMFTCTKEIFKVHSRGVFKMKVFDC